MCWEVWRLPCQVPWWRVHLPYSTTGRGASKKDARISMDKYGYDVGRMAMAAIGAPLRRVSQIAPTMRLLAEMMIMSLVWNPIYISQPALLFRWQHRHQHDCCIPLRRLQTTAKMTTSVRTTAKMIPSLLLSLLLLLLLLLLLDLRRFYNNTSIASCRYMHGCYSCNCHCSYCCHFGYCHYCLLVLLWLQLLCCCW